MSMDADEIARLRALCEAATRAPWHRGGMDAYDGECFKRMASGHGMNHTLVADTMRSADRDFCIAARTALPAALDEIERLRDIINPGDAAAYEEGMASLTEANARLKAQVRAINSSMEHHVATATAKLQAENAALGARLDRLVAAAESAYDKLTERAQSHVRGSVGFPMSDPNARAYCDVLCDALNTLSAALAEAKPREGASDG